MCLSQPISHKNIMDLTLFQTILEDEIIDTIG